MSIKSKFKTFFYLDDNSDDYEEDFVEEEEQEPAKQLKKSTAKQNIVSLQSIQKSSKMVLIEPRVFAESQEIADHLKSRRSVVVNLQRIERDQAQRVIDFLGGAVYALGGDIQKIGIDIFLCTPDNVEVSGNISEMFKQHD
ncbi:cell division protein SepF [Pseudoneobacillus sp. C159]